MRDKNFNILTDKSYQILDRLLLLLLLGDREKN